MAKPEMSVSPEGEFAGKRAELDPAERDRAIERIDNIYTEIQEDYQETEKRIEKMRPEPGQAAITNKDRGQERTRLLGDSVEFFPEDEHEVFELAVVRAFYYLPRMADTVVEISTYKNQIKPLMPAEEQEKRLGEASKLFLFASAWQIEVSRMIEGLRSLDHPQREAILKDFWKKAEQIFEERIGSTEEYQGIKVGILGLTPIIQLAEQLDLQVFYPTIRQDAFEKVDLWIGDPRTPKEHEVLAIQVKSSSIGTSTRIDYQEISGPRETAEEAATAQKLLTAAKKYSNVFNTKVTPVWVEVGGISGDSFDLNETTGEALNLEHLAKSSFAQYLRDIHGKEAA